MQLDEKTHVKSEMHKLPAVVGTGVVLLVLIVVLIVRVDDILDVTGHGILLLESIIDDHR